MVVRVIVVEISSSYDQWVKLPKCWSTVLIQMLLVAIHPVLLYSYTVHVELPVGAVYS